MSYHEKRTIAMIITGILVLIVYSIYAIGQYRAGAAAPDDLRFWATAMLIFVGIEVAATIVIQVLFHILVSISIAVKETIHGQCDDKKLEETIDAEMVEDEMDKLIDLKSMRVSFTIAGAGFAAGLVSLVLGWAPAVMLNILFGAFSIGSLVQGFTQLYFYRSGIRHG